MVSGWAHHVLELKQVGVTLANPEVSCSVAFLPLYPGSCEFQAPPTGRHDLMVAFVISRQWEKCYPIS